MEVNAQLFYWTQGGMRCENPPQPEHLQSFFGGERFVRVRDAEQLLELAHRRGFEAGARACAERMP